jgi:hypothetical protein
MSSINFRQISQNRTPLVRTNANISYIVVHDTGNTSSGANANAHFNYFNGANRNASADFFVDSAQILQVNDYLKFFSWHSGDGNGQYGITNRNSVGIEMCINSDGNYNVMLEKTVWLVRHLMSRLNIPISRVVRHWDASRKMCPNTMSANNWAAWNSFKSRVTNTNTTPAPSNPAPVDRNRWIQTSLNRIGYNLAVDGSIGPLSTAAIRDFQSIADLDVDGSFGPKTEAKMKEILASTRLTRVYLSINVLHKVKIDANDVIVSDRKGWIRRASADDGIYWLIYKVYLKLK